MSLDLQIGLKRLLGLTNLDEFLENIWERTTHFAPTSIRDSLTEILTQDQFEILMASATSGTTTGLSIVNDQIARPVIRDEGDSSRLPWIFDAYAKGCTVVQSGLQLRWMPITRICREIENELISQKVILSEMVGANAYLTPANSQAFDIHYDNHCVLILQLHGRKQWTVFPPKEVLPTARCTQPLPRDQLDAPIMESELIAGDVLYIPRGFPHYARTGKLSSLHLTLSLRTLTWLEVLDALCRTNSNFRRSVHMSIKNALPPQEYFECGLIPQLGSMEVSAFLQRRLSERLAGLFPLPGGRLRSIDETALIDANVRVKRAPQVECVASEENGEAVLRFPGGTLRLPARMKPVFDFVANHREFTASELPSIEANYDAGEFTRILIRKGLVCPVKASKERESISARKSFRKGQEG